MTFTKLSDESKELIEQYKKQYGNEHVGSYRALLMRGQSHDDCMKIINSRKTIQPIETKKVEVFQPTTTEKAKPKRQPKKQKVEAPEVLAVENTKVPEPAPSPKAKGERKKKT